MKNVSFVLMYTSSELQPIDSVNTNFVISNDPDDLKVICSYINTFYSEPLDVSDLLRLISVGTFKTDTETLTLRLRRSE